jgi:hypothetical protein
MVLEGENGIFLTLLCELFFRACRNFFFAHRPVQETGLGGQGLDGLGLGTVFSSPRCG